MAVLRAVPLLRALAGADFAAWLAAGVRRLGWALGQTNPVAAVPARGYVLVVEANAWRRQAIQARLRAAGAAAEATSSGLAALALAARLRPEFVVLGEPLSPVDRADVAAVLAVLYGDSLSTLPAADVLERARSCREWSGGVPLSDPERPAGGLDQPGPWAGSPPPDRLARRQLSRHSEHLITEVYRHD